MKKLLTVLLVAVLALVLAVSASAEYYNPGYYCVQKVDAGTITVDGALDEAYGEPIFYFVAEEGMDEETARQEAGDYTQSSNWFTTKDTSENAADVLALLLVSENYVKGYSVWTDDSIYFCVDINLLGWNMPAKYDKTSWWQGYCAQLCMFDTQANTYVDYLFAIHEDGSTLQSGGGTIPTMEVDIDKPETLLNAKVERSGDHVVYEVEVPFTRLLSYKPEVGGSMGLNVCIGFADNTEDSYVQKWLTFIQPVSGNNYHHRNTKTATPLYFCDGETDSARAAYLAQANASELAAKEDDAGIKSVSLFGCNEVPANTNFILDDSWSSRMDANTEGVGSLILNLSTLGGKPNSVNAFAIDPVNGEGYDSLQFMMNVTDLTLFDSATGTITISSSGNASKQAVSWTLEDIKNGADGVSNTKTTELETGWNVVTLAIPADADIDLSNVNYIDLTIDNTSVERVMMTLDNMRLSNAQYVALEEFREDGEKINARIEKLDDITEKNVNSMKVKVNSARTAYEKLDERAKQFVSADMLDRLAELEQKIEDIVNGVTDVPAPGEDDPVDPIDPPVDPVDPPVDPVDPPVDPGKTENNNTTLIIIIAVAAVVVVAVAVVVVIVLKKKKKSDWTE